MDDNPTVEQIIREEAYAIWKVRQRLKIPGTAVGDWLQAEDVIRHQLHQEVFSYAAKAYLNGKNDEPAS